MNVKYTKKYIINKKYVEILAIEAGELYYLVEFVRDMCYGNPLWISLNG